MVKEEHVTPPLPPLTSFPARLQVRGDPCPPCIPETPFSSRAGRTQPALPAQTKTPLLMRTKRIHIPEQHVASPFICLLFQISALFISCSAYSHFHPDTLAFNTFGVY